MSTQDKIKREVFPIPDKPYMGLTTFDAKDPDTSFPKHEPLRPLPARPAALVAIQVKNQHLSFTSQREES